VSVPVVASGGIVDGRGLAAALALGAAGAQLGTRFLLAREAGTAPADLAALERAVETDTVVTTVHRTPGEEHPQPVRRPALGGRAAALALQRYAAEDIYAAAFGRGDAELIPLLAGQGLRGLRDGQPAAEIVEEVTAEADAVLRAR